MTIRMNTANRINKQNNKSETDKNIHTSAVLNDRYSYGLTLHILMTSDGSSPVMKCGRPSRAAVLLLSFVSYETKEHAVP